MSPSSLDKVRDRQAKSRERNKGAIVKVVIYGGPLLVLVLGFFGYRHYTVLSMIEEARQIVAEARAYNATTEALVKEIVPSEADPLPPNVAARLDYSWKLVKILGSVLHGGGRLSGKGGKDGQAQIAPLLGLPGMGLLPVAGSSTAPTDEGPPELADENLTPRERAIREAVAMTELISRQCALIEDRLDVCEASGELSMLPGTEQLIERYRSLKE